MKILQLDSVLKRHDNEIKITKEIVDEIRSKHLLHLDETSAASDDENISVIGNSDDYIKY